MLMPFPSQVSTKARFIRPCLFSFLLFIPSFMLSKIHEEFLLNLDQEMRQQVAKYAAAMKRMGVQVGDRVAGQQVL